MITFTTIHEAIDACESAGLEPIASGGQYGVIPAGCSRYINCYSDEEFLRFCNAYFNLPAASDRDQKH